MIAKWLTDLHLDQVIDPDVFTYGCSALFLTGDMGNDKYTSLKFMEAVARTYVPTYYVLGNHDFHGGDTSEVISKHRNLAIAYPTFHYLTNQSAMKIGYGNEIIYIVGTDGWYDMLNGNIETPVTLSDWVGFNGVNDYMYCNDNIDVIGRTSLFLAYAFTEVLRSSLLTVPTNADRVYILSHVPMKQAAYHNGKLTEDHMLPYMSSKLFEDVVLEFAAKRPQTHFYVLTGHTHHYACVNPAKNVTHSVNPGGVDSPFYIVL